MIESHTTTALLYRGPDGSPDVRVRDLDTILEIMAEDLLSLSNSEVEISIVLAVNTKDIRTLPQLAYLFGHLAPIVYTVLKNDGWDNIQTKEKGIEILKFELDFCEHVEHPVTGETISIPLSLSKVARTNRKRVTEFVRGVYLWLLNKGAQPKTLKEWQPYKKRKK